MASSRKSYPALPWFGLAAAAVFLLGVIRFFAGSAEGEVNPLLLALAVAALLPFVALLFPRRAPGSARPRLDLSHSARDDLKGALEELDREHAEGKLPDERYRKARAKLEEALKRA